MKLRIDENVVLKEMNDIEDVARFFQRSTSTIQRWYLSGKFPQPSNGLWSKETIQFFVECAQPSKKEIRMCAENFRGF